MVDYLCWILLAGAIGKTFGEPFDIPLLPSIVLLVIYGFEINSCYGNYFEAHGRHVKVDIFKFFRRKSDIIDIEEKTENEDNNYTDSPFYILLPEYSVRAGRDSKDRERIH